SGGAAVEQATRPRERALESLRGGQLRPQNRDLDPHLGQARAVSIEGGAHGNQSQAARPPHDRVLGVERNGAPWLDRRRPWSRARARTELRVAVPELGAVLVEHADGSTKVGLDLDRSG